MSEITIHGQRFDIAAFSEQGPRAENQDAYSIDEFAEHGLIALADGMGGEKSGRLAADTALEALVRSVPIRSVDAARRAVREANDVVTRASEADPDRFGGMGCALALLSLTNGGDGIGWVAAHVGDVRILSRSPDGVLRLETRDHTPAFMRWEAGEISLDQIPESPGANRLQRAVGRGGEADVSWMPIAPGWSWLLISDGVSKAVRLDELATLMSAATAVEACDSLRRRVAERGPDDNFTAVFVRAVDDVAPHAAPASPEASRSAMSTRSPSRSSRSGLALIATIAAFAALGLSLLALARGRSTDQRIAEVEIERLRSEVDSLRALMDGLMIDDPFGPTAPEPGPADVPPAGAP